MPVAVAVPRREIMVVVTLILALSAATSVELGQDVNWDLLNYHFYNGYAFLNGRLDQDIAPGGPQTYLNPLLDAGHYLGMRHLTPWLFGALLGAIQGLNIVLVWAIVRFTLGASGRLPALLAALLAATGQNALSLLGTSFGDTTVSIPALAGVLLLVGSKKPGIVCLSVAGLAGGAAVGLKLTMIAPHVGLALVAGLIALQQRRTMLLVSFAAGTLAGWGLTGGWWAIEMWKRFANPVFPFANGVFQSSYGPPYSVTFSRWSPRTPWDWLGTALDAALGQHERLQEVSVHDPRLLLALIVVTGLLLVTILRLRNGKGDLLPIQALGLYWVATYAVWFAVFHYYRYAALLEFLAPALALISLTYVGPRRAVNAVATLLAVAVLVATSVAQWDRREWTTEWFRAGGLPPSARRSNQLVLLPEPATSYVIPFFPADSAFVGLSWGFGPAMSARISARVREHSGPLLVLASPPRRRVMNMRPLGLVVHGPCECVDLGAPTRPFLCRLGAMPGRDGEFAARRGAPPNPELVLERAGRLVGGRRERLYPPFGLCGDRAPTLVRAGAK